MQRIGQRLDRTHHGQALGFLAVGGQRGDERAVDLQCGERVLVQVAERGIARAEVIQCDAGTVVAQVLQHPFDLCGILQQRVFGYLDADVRGGNVVSLEQLQQALIRIDGAEVPAGHVDADEAVFAHQTVGLRAGLFEDLPVDEFDAAGLLGDQQEIGRQQQPALGMVPAQQRLVADGTAIGQRHDGLVVRHELVADQRVAQVALHVQQRQRLASQAVVEHGGAMAATVLGVVHRRVGVAQQLLRLAVMRAGQGDADGGGGEDLLDAQPERRLQRTDDAVGDLGSGGRVVHVFQQHRELIAAQSGNHVTGLEAGAHAATDLEQQVVADQMADRIVDDLEAVQVDEQHREQIQRIGQVALQGLLQPLQEQGAIGQPGE